MIVLLNPPTRRKAGKKGSRKRSSSMRTRRRRSTSRSRRRNPARKTARKSTRKRKSARRKSARRKPAKRRAARKTTRRRVRRPAGKRMRPVVYKQRRGYVASRRSRLAGKRVRRANPKLNFLPNLKDTKELLLDGTFGLIGWVGQNLATMLADKAGAGDLKTKVGAYGPVVINTGVRIIAVPLIAMIAGALTKNPSRRKAIVVGAAVNLVAHGIREFAEASPGTVPVEVTNVLGMYDDPASSGYGRIGDYLALPSGGMNDYLTDSGMPAAIGTTPGVVSSANSGALTAQGLW